MNQYLIGLSLFLSITTNALLISAYEPTWQSLDTRKLPQWYDESKIGIFIHWGVFSVPGFGQEWFWYNLFNNTREWHNDTVKFMKDNYPPKFTYQDFAAKFTAEFFDPDKWAELLKASGAKYMVLTTKHHEGFTLWPSKYSWNWNAVDIGPKRDIVGLLEHSIRKQTDLHFGLYHSLMEWYHPLFLQDVENNYTTHQFVDTKSMPELYELVDAYRPEIVWSDHDGGGSDTYWRSRQFIAWLYNESPVKDTVVVNDRWGHGLKCHHGDVYTCRDRYNPQKIIEHKWENCFPLDWKSWGYRRNADLADYLTIHQVITYVAETVSCNGNVLINIGPTHDGRIDPIQEERLRQLGEWLAVNGEAIYGTTYTAHPNDNVTKSVWYTTKSDEIGSPLLYAIVLTWPKNNQLTLGSIALESGTTVTMLGIETPLQWTHNSNGTVIIDFPALSPEQLPSLWAWSLKFSKTA